LLTINRKSSFAYLPDITGAVSGVK